MRFWSGKRVFWSKWFRLYTDGGWPKVRAIPRFNRMHYDPHWGMCGFCVTWLGRQVFFSFGRDINKFYDRECQS
jgi:hypothetical protein